MIEGPRGLTEIESVLRAAPSWGRIKQIVMAHRKDGEDDAKAIEALCRHIGMALAGPEPHELLTATERRASAAKIVRLSKGLAAELTRLNGGAAVGKRWPFWYQAMLDRLALTAALDYRDQFHEDIDPEFFALLGDDEAGFHIARYSAYHLLMEGIPELLDALVYASEQWALDDPVLAKPNHPNARRLYFIRRMTSYFLHSYGQPMRELTLAVTELFFECEDLVEADLSNLAPVPKGKKRGVSLSLVKSGKKPD